MSNWKEQLKNINEHSFDEWSLNLMSKDFIFSDWACEQVGENNDGIYRAGYNNLEIVDNGEPMVPCIEYGLASRDYYLGVMLDQSKNNELIAEYLKDKLLFPFAWLRITVVERLVKADLVLREHGMFLSVASGWRDSKVQTLGKSLMASEYSKKYVDKAIAEYKPGGTTPHMTGGAVDVELWSLKTGKPLSYSYPGDIINAFVMEKKNPISEEENIKKKIRRILYHVLASPEIVLKQDEVFIVHPGEYWHFGYGDPLSAYLNGHTKAIYGAVQPAVDYKYHNKSWI